MLKITPQNFMQKKNNDFLITFLSSLTVRCGGTSQYNNNEQDTLLKRASRVAKRSRRLPKLQDPDRC